MQLLKLFRSVVGDAAIGIRVHRAMACPRLNKKKIGSGATDEILSSFQIARELRVSRITGFDEKEEQRANI